MIKEILCVVLGFVIGVWKGDEIINGIAHLI